MKLSLEQIIVLANTPEWPVPKSEIVTATLEDLKSQWRSVLSIIDQLVAYRYIERNAGLYNIKPEGQRALETGFFSLETTNEKIKSLIKARQ